MRRRRSTRAIVGLSPVVVPSAFQFPAAMAAEFAGMLTGVTGPDLVNQWNALPPLASALSQFAPRPVLLVASAHDDIFPPSQYAGAIAGLANIELVDHAGADRSFSACCPWLVRTVTEWPVRQLPR